MGIFLLGKSSAGLAFGNPVLFPNYDFPLIDIFQHADRVWEFKASGITSFSGANYSVLNAAGLPTAMPSGIDNLKVYVVMHAQPGDVWVLDWVGSANLAVGSGDASMTQNIISSNRIEYTVNSFTSSYPPPLFLANVQVFSVTTPITQIRLYPKAQESRLTAGFITNLDFANIWKQFYGIRYMNWQNMNGSLEGDWNLRTIGSASQNSFRGDRYNGTPTLDTAGTNDFTCPTAYTGNPSSWTQAMSLLSGPLPAVIVHNISSIATGTTTTVTTSAVHNMSSGQRYMFTLSNVFPNATGSYNALLNKVHSITVTGPSSFTVPVNSTGWTGTIPPTGMPALRIKAGSLPYKECYANFMGSFYNVQFNTPGEPALESSLLAANQFVYDSINDLLLNWTVSRNNGTARGMSVETLVQIANELNIHPWFSIPILANSTYITNFVTYVRDHLNSNLIAYFEPSNEIWNTSVGFHQSSYATSWAYKLFPSITGDEQARAEYTGYFAYVVHSIVTSVYAGQMNRVQRVQATWASQYNNDGYHAWQLEAPHTTVAGLPKTVTDYYAYAPYIEPDRTSAPTAEMVYLYKTGNSTVQNAQLLALDQMFNASECSFTGYISGTTLFVTAISVGQIDVGMTLSQYTPFNFAVLPGTWVKQQLTGTANGVGTYQLALSQTVGSSGSPVALRDSGIFTRKLMKDQMFPYFNTLCATYGLKHGTYEGGWGPYPQYDVGGSRGDPIGTYLGNTVTETDISNFWLAYHGSSYWAATFLQMMHDYKAAGGLHFNQFQISGIEWGMGTQFGELICGTYGDQAKPGYQALLTYNGGA